MIAFLPHQAWISVDAIARACYRSWVSRRHVLEWQTADAAQANADEYLRSTETQVLAVAAISGTLMLILGLKGQFVPTSAFLALWMSSPLLLRWLNSPAMRLKTQLARADVGYLRRSARRTWRYFDDVVGEESNWLPPDNSQMALHVEVAQRTSPTNIGLWLTSALAAYDFGFLSADDFLQRCSKTMDTLDRVERYEGHILNWYNTRTLEPLTPRYVSSVDSGNLIASLWALAKGCADVMDEPIIGPSSVRGLSDTLTILSEAANEDPYLATSLQSARRLLRGVFRGHHLIGRLRLVSHSMSQLRDQRWEAAQKDERAYWSARLVQECGVWVESIDNYLCWLETLARPPDTFLRELGEDVVAVRRQTLNEIPSLRMLAEQPLPLETILARRGMPDMRPEAAAWLDQIEAQFSQSRARAREAVEGLKHLADRANTLADGINMRFLYDEKRRLFSVGYALGGPPEFTSYYDLLASESRLASLVAIAKRDVPIEHWFALNRPRSGAGDHQALLSWSGTMFEYLMPLLVMPPRPFSLLDQTCHSAVTRQMAYAHTRGVPWGISESAYNVRDRHDTYQYRAFGVPDLALKRGLASDLVVAPYATALALAVEAHEALRNLAELERRGALGA
jgi:cyclic beta-1,2-glucan synthetase